MNYNAEQREILRRLGEVSQRYHAAAAAHNQAQVTVTHELTGAVVALAAAVERSTELTTLFLEHGDLWREFLDTL